MGVMNVTLPTFTSTLTSLLLCLINSSLLPSQKDLLWKNGITKMIVEMIKDVCFICIY
jgi:hypothetical protein